MAIVTCRETWPQRDGEFQSSGQEAALVRHFTVKTSTATDDSVTIYTSGQLPARGSGHPSYTNAKADRFRIRNRSEHPTLWDVTVEYSTTSGGFLPQAKEIEPTLRAAQISWDSAQFRKPMERAYQAFFGVVGSVKVPVTNSADKPFNPPLEMDDSRPSVTIIKNMYYTPLWLLDYQDAVNGDGFYVDGVAIQPYQAKMQKVAVSPLQLENNVLFRQVAMVMHLRRDYWFEEILDRGYEEKIYSDNGTAIFKRITDSQGRDVSEPAWLDGAGRAINMSGPDPEPFYRVYLPYDLRPFSALPLS